MKPSPRRVCLAIMLALLVAFKSSIDLGVHDMAGSMVTRERPCTPIHQLITLDHSEYLPNRRRCGHALLQTFPDPFDSTVFYLIAINLFHGSSWLRL